MDNSFASSHSHSSRLSRAATSDEGSLFAHRARGGGGAKSSDGMSSIGSLTKYTMSDWVLALQVVLRV